MGATASGKTRFAIDLCRKFNGSVISADSRQVYKHLDIGTGKDLSEYTSGGTPVDHYLIDLIEPGEKYYLHDFVSDLLTAFEKISASEKLPVICGGTGLYLDALRKDFSFTLIPENNELRAELELLDKSELEKVLKSFPPGSTAHVDRNSKKRLIRGIEIAEHARSKGWPPKSSLPYQPVYLGLALSKEERNEKIVQRLKWRLENGLIEESRSLHQAGLSFSRMEELGLEYKFLSAFLQSKISYKELENQLGTAIQQYAKRQMTWFRKMEKEGVRINWIHPDTDPGKALADLNLAH